MTDREHNVQRRRRMIGYATIVAVAPYLVLKVLWLSGNMLGVPEHSPAYRGWGAQNAVTLCMDIAAVAIGLALTRDWGHRVPASLIIVPAWVATGFLAPAVVEVPVGFISTLVTSGQLVSLRGGLVEPWAYAVVYSSFAAQGVLLGIAFAGYVRSRWSVWLAPAGLSPNGAHTVQRAVAVCCAIPAAFVAAVQLTLAVIAPDGWRADDWSMTTRMVQAVEGSFAATAAASLLALAGVPVMRPTIRVPTKWQVALTWSGSGVMFSYGSLRTFSALAGLPLSEQIPPAARIVNLAAMVAGLMLAVTAVLILAEDRSRVVADFAEAERR